MRINLLTLGDCNDLNTWSNLPYYFYRNLLAHSIDVRPIDLTPSQNAASSVFEYVRALQVRAVRMIRPGYGSDPLRTRAFHRLVNRRLRAMAGQLNDADLNLFLTFSFSSFRYAGSPVIHYCDRTYEHYLEECRQTPSRMDRIFIGIDRQNIESADLVLTTGELCADFIRSRYKAKRVICLRAGNNTDLDVTNPDALINGKEHSTDILFIGRGVQKRGVDILVRAFALFNHRHDGRFTLHIVGVQPEELPQDLRATDRNIKFHGYLDRAVPADLQRYNDLLRSARLFVMPMRLGPLPGVIREVQLSCTPVIVSDRSRGRDVITSDLDSVLVDSLEPEAYAHHMDHLVQDSDRWRTLALNGHTARRNQTWMSTVDRFLQIVQDCRLVASQS
jgi:glycosyltransferase involved in cell wall biosynthesis